MIPRKRLQVLLYILQIFYVFGDGDPGSEDLIVNELPDNIINDSSFTTMSFPVQHSIRESIVSMEEKPSNISQDIYALNYKSKEDVNLNSHENGIVNNLDNSSTDAQTEIVSVNANVTGATSANISWCITGDNATKYVIELFFNETVIKTFETVNLYYFIKNLKACCKYKVKVSSFSMNYNDSKFKEFETLPAKIGKPLHLNAISKRPSMLEINWDAPKDAGCCIKNYRVTIDNQDEKNRHILYEYTNNTSYIFKNVYACLSYLVTVTPIDISNKDASSESLQSNLTLTEVTSAPAVNTSDSRSVNSTTNSITLIWQVTDKKNYCLLKSITCTCNFINTTGHGFELTNGTSILKIPEGEKPTNVSITVKNLSPFTNYICKAQLFNDAGYSLSSEPISVQTSEDKPTPPRNFQKFGRDENSKLLFIWETPRYKPGIIQCYKINFTWSPHYPVPDGCKVNREYIVTNIAPSLTQFILLDEEADSHYLAKISAKTNAGWSNEETIEFDSTSEGIPDKVTNLSCTIKSQTLNPNILDTELSWNLPCSLRGILSYFEVSAIGTRAGRENDIITDIVNVTDEFDKNQIFRKNFGELKPLYNYNFEVSATLIGSTESGETSNLTVQYPPGIPSQPNEDYIKSITLDPQKARRTTSTAAILLPLFPTDNGEIKHYAILVSGIPFDNSSSKGRFNITGANWPNVSSWAEAMENDFKIPYQATQLTWNPFPKYVVDYGHMKAVKFVVGEDAICPLVSETDSIRRKRTYCNGPLKPDTWYEVRMRAFTEKGYADSVSFIIKTNAELNVGLVLGVVFGILFIGILTTLMLLVKRCSFRLLVQRILQSNIPESPVPNPFTRRKFINHCQQLAENPGKLSNEFQLLQTLSVDLQMPSNAACLQANRKKNRYLDILPYDFSRVKLEIIDNDPNTDYINASFIRGYSGHEEYIACQGPKEETTYDFWRMIDQYDVKMILMLTQLVEKGKEKCHQYFPTIRETFTYEKLSIRCTSELDYRTYTQRTFVLQKEDTRRTITHLHFKDWPDHDVPDDFDAMIHFCQIFRKQLNAVKGLSVIHCSAGIGRTGTLIAIDILLQSIRDNRKLDVFGTVYRLRRHRLNMVQRESQYAYIYNCIRQVLKNPYFLKSYKPPPIDPIYPKSKTKKDRNDSSTDLVDSFDTLKKNSLSTSIDSMQPLCQSSPQTTPKIQMNVLFAGLRYCKSTSAIDTRTNHNRIGRYSSEGYAICGSSRHSFSTTSKESTDENDLKSSSSSLYENVEPLIKQSSSQTIAGSSYYLTNDSVEKDTSL